MAITDEYTNGDGETVTVLTILNGLSALEIIDYVNGRIDVAAVLALTDQRRTIENMMDEMAVKVTATLADASGQFGTVITHADDIAAFKPMVESMMAGQRLGGTTGATLDDITGCAASWIVDNYPEAPANNDDL